MTLLDLFKRNKEKNIKEVKLSSPMELYIKRLEKLYGRCKNGRNN